MNNINERPRRLSIMMKEKKKYEEYQRDPDFYVDLTEVKINVFVFVLIFTVKKYLNFLNSHMTLAGKVVPVPKKVPKKKTSFLSQWKVLGEGVSDRNIKVFLIFFCFLLDFSVFPICSYIVRSKHPLGLTFH